MHTIKQLTAEAERIGEEVKSTFGYLHADQLNWKPEPGRWGVGQCIDHLIVTNTTYFPTLKSIAAGTKTTTYWEKLPYLPAYFGKALIRSFQPNAQRKLKAPKVFKPAASAVRADIIAHFVNHQQELIVFIQQSESVDHKKTIITSPVSRFVTYSLEDAFTILLVHERRHMEQAKRVMQHARFPGGGTLSND